MDLKKLKSQLKRNKKEIEELVIYLSEQEDNPTESDFDDRWCMKEQLRGMFSAKDWLERRIRRIEKRKGGK